jgi:RimJ/RimL family protein N-acetyltransferase
MFLECIESERILLRDVTEADAKMVYSIWSNPENDKYMSDPVTSLQEVKEICRDRTEDMDTLKVVILKETGEVIGTCCLEKQRERQSGPLDTQ